MKVKVAINGFGRIGRMVFRKAMLDEQIDIAVINAVSSGNARSFNKV